MTSSAPVADTVFDIVSSYIDMGCHVLPLWGLSAKNHCKCPLGDKCRSAGKHPLTRLVPNGVKNATLDKTMLRSWISRAPGCNWAIRCGDRLLDGRYLTVLDRDPRNGGDESLVEVIGKNGDLPETVAADSGGGGGHYLFGSPTARSSGTAGPGLDILGSGKYFVVAPSVHPSGGSYQWALGLAPGDVRIADAPEWLLEGTGGAAGARPEREGGTAVDTILGEAFRIAGKLGTVYPDGMASVCCPWADEHSSGSGRGEDSSTVILPPAGGSRFGGFSCKHGHCSNRNWEDVLRALPAHAVAAAQQKYPRRPVAVPDDYTPPPTPAEPTAPVAGGVSNRDYLADVRLRLAYAAVGKNGSKVKPDLINLITILTYDPRWKGLLRFDTFSQVLLITRPPTWHTDDKPREQGNTWSDEDTTRLDAWLRREWGVEMKIDPLRTSVYVVGKRDAINPLTDWLDTLEWDGTPRLDTWLSHYLGSPDTPYVRAVGRKWMISAIARAYKPGSKADHIMILEGPQGKGKSTALRALVGDAFFSDSPIDIGSKDSFQALRGKWVIELQELASLKKSDADKAKAYFSSPSDRYRPSYGREMVEIPRSTVFCGSVNHGVYLNDSTGGRRYWGVPVGVIDVTALKEDREQLWAEARDRFRKNEIWWPTFEEVPMFEEQQEARESGDGWDSTVSAFLSSEKAANIIKHNELITTAQIAESLGIEIGRLEPGMQTRIGQVMTRLKWVRGRKSFNGARVYGFKPPV